MFNVEKVNLYRSCNYSSSHLLYDSKFLFFDKWVMYSSEKQLNTSIKNKDTKSLKEIAKDNKTYQFLKSQDKVSINEQSDNQGSGHIGYYQVNINDKPATLTVKIKYALLPEKPKIKSVELND